MADNTDLWFAYKTTLQSRHNSFKELRSPFYHFITKTVHVLSPVLFMCGCCRLLASIVEVRFGFATPRPVRHWWHLELFRTHRRGELHWHYRSIRKEPSQLPSSSRAHLAVSVNINLVLIVEWTFASIFKRPTAAKR